MKTNSLSKFEKFKNLTKLPTLNTPAKSSLYFTTANLISKGASFVLTPIFTRLLTTAEYGEYSLFVSYLSIAIVIVTLEIPGSIIMRAFQKRRELENVSLIIAFSVSCLLSLPCVLTIRFLTHSSGLSFPFAYPLLLLSLLATSLNNLYISKSKFHYRWQLPLVIAITQSVLAPTLSIILIRTSALHKYGNIVLKIGTVTAINAALAITLLALTVYNARGEIKSQHLQAKELYYYAKDIGRFLLKLSLPLLPYYFSVMIISQSDKLFIASRIGSDALARYSIAYSAAIALTAVTGGFMSALSPWIMRKVRAADTEILRCTFRLIIKLTLPLIIIFLCACPEIFSFLAPKEYQSALPVLFIVSIIPLPLALSQCLCSIAVAKEKIVGVIISGIIPAVFALVGNMFFTRNENIYIPALITSLSYLILMLCNSLNIKKITSKTPLDAKQALQSLLLFTVVSSVIFNFIDVIWVRIIIALLTVAYLLYMLNDTKMLLCERS